ncbi:MAG: GNAT family N-acetyltransferase [Caldilineaceae bacterium]|nr:GNAT family N-acetyltransferase [Caldilineaceae bacterium]
MDDYIFRPAQLDDWPQIAALLTRYELPLDGAIDHLPWFLVAETSDGTLAGVAGLERYGNVGLLRSVAVAEQRHGLGRALVERIIATAVDSGLTAIVLLTTTAASYFTHFGFSSIQRDEAPAAVRASAEFQGACPDSATVMWLDLKLT